MKYILEFGTKDERVDCNLRVRRKQGIKLARAISQCFGEEPSCFTGLEKMTDLDVVGWCNAVAFVYLQRKKG